jgi:hypothetical protein
MSYPMATVIRLTLVCLYLALVAPLPWLAPAASQAGVWLAVGLGLVLIVALTSEQVVVDDSGIAVIHPPWCRWLLRRGWALDWPSVSALTPVATSQGGRVFYVRSSDGSAFLLPQRVANFDDFLSRFCAASGIDTTSVVRISPPWTYQLLGGLSATLLLAEVGFGLGIALRG